MKNTNTSTFRRAAALLLCFALIMAGLAGCGQQGGAGTGSQGGATEAATAPDSGSNGGEPASSENSGGEAAGGQQGTAEPAPEPVKAPDPLDLYDAFLNEKALALFTIEAIGLEEGREYNIREMKQSMEKFLDGDYMPDKVCELGYAFIDCGLDGVPELALRFEFISDDTEYPSYSTEYFVLKAYGDELRVIDNEETYYRTESTLNSAGYITYGGSGGAATYYCSYHYINPEGKKVFLYSGEYTLANGAPIIQAWDLPEEGLPEDYPTDYDFYEDGLEIDIYNFTTYDYDDTGEMQDEYHRHNMFVILDSDGNDVDPEEYYGKLYEELGVGIYKDAEMAQMIQDHMAACGCTEEIVNAPDIEWELLEADWLPKG